MTSLKNLLLVVFLGSLSGCILITPRVRPANSPRMKRSEAVTLARSECSRRGYRCDLQNAHETGRGVWKVKFKVARADVRGHLHLDYDTWSGRLIDVDENVKHRGRKHEDDRGRGRHHGASAGRHD